MKITIQSLKKLIKEEHSRLVQENPELWAKEEKLNKDLDGDGIIGHPDVAHVDINEEEGDMPDISRLVQQGPQAVIAAICGRLGGGGAEKIASFVKAFLANPNADIAGLLDEHLGEGHGMMANFLLKMKIEQAGGQTLEQLLVPLRAAFTAAQGFGGMIPGIKEAWEAAQQAAMAVTLPLIKAGCSAAEKAAPAEPEEQAPAAPMQEHITKDLLKKLVKEQLQSENH
jgi:hypothetical protein